MTFEACALNIHSGCQMDVWAFGREIVRTVTDNVMGTRASWFHEFRSGSRYRWAKGSFHDPAPCQRGEACGGIAAFDVRKKHGLV